MQTSFSIVFLFLFAFFASTLATMAVSVVPAHANNALYTVHNVTVDVTAGNALVAREQAFEQAQVQAFTELAERLALGGGDAAKSVPDPVTLSAMIRDYEVTRERLSSVRYIGTYTFRFKEDSVRNYFSQKKVKIAEAATRPLLMLPFYRKENGYDLWSHENVWKAAWDRDDGRGRLVPVVIPVGDLQDVRFIGDNDAMNYEPVNMEHLLERYGAREAVIAVATPDSGFSSADGVVGTDAAYGSLEVELYRTDAFRPQLVRRIIVTAQSGQSRNDVFSTAVGEVRKVLGENWKEKSLAAVTTQAQSAAQGSGLTVHIPIASLQEWTVIQTKARSTVGIQDVQVRSLTPKKVTAVFVTASDVHTLTRALALRGLELRVLAASAGKPPIVNKLTGAVTPAPVEYELRHVRPATPDMLAPSADEEATSAPPAESGSDVAAPSSGGGYQQRF